MKAHQPSKVHALIAIENAEKGRRQQHTTRGGGDAGKIELAQEMVVLSHGTLTLVNLDRDRRLNAEIVRQR